MWLIKAYNEETNVTQEKYFNKYLFKARVVTENAYGMMKREMETLTQENRMSSR